MAASQPDRPQNQAEAREVLSEAKQKSIPIPKKVVEQTGKTFIEASRRDPKAWDVALEFFNYRSNPMFHFHRKITSIPLPTQKVVVSYDLGPLVPGKPGPRLERLTEAFVAYNETARYESIGQNLNTEGGPPALVVRGGAVNLDGKDIRHVIFENVEIHYTGKPLILENVVFFNCTFVLDNNEPVRQLGEHLLASAETVNLASDTVPDSQANALKKWKLPIEG